MKDWPSICKPFIWALKLLNEDGRGVKNTRAGCSVFMHKHRKPSCRFELKNSWFQTLLFKVVKATARKQKCPKFELAIFSQTSNRAHDIKQDYAIVINMCQSTPGIICTLAQHHQTCQFFLSECIIYAQGFFRCAKRKTNWEKWNFHLSGATPTIMHLGSTQECTSSASSHVDVLKK